MKKNEYLIIILFVLTAIGGGLALSFDKIFVLFVIFAVFTYSYMFLTKKKEVFTQNKKTKTLTSLMIVFSVLGFLLILILPNDNRYLAAAFTVAIVSILLIFYKLEVNSIKKKMN